MPQRYFLETEHTFFKQDLHHIRHVMRMKTDDLIIVCFQGQCYEAKLVVTPDQIQFTKTRPLPNQNQLDVTIIQGQPKGSKIDFIVKSASLFGAKKVIFTHMQRSIGKLENTDHKLKRLSVIAKEASELSHRQLHLEINFEKRLETIDFKAFDIILLADELESNLQLKHALKDFKKDMKIAFIIGPEGGISPQERQMLNALGAISISLGERILPTEYAHLYILSYLSANYL